MKRVRSSVREFWIAIGVSVVFHFLAGLVFWAISGNVTTERPEMEVEWTWSAPTAEKPTPGTRSNPAPTVGEQTGATLSPAPVAKTGSGSSPDPGNAVISSPVAGAGTTPGSATKAASPGTGIPTGGPPAASSAASLPGSATPSATSTFDMSSGDSTGFALVPPKIRERPAISLPSEAIQAGVSGNVLLLVEVMEDGRVGKVVVNRSSGSKLLDESARENVSRWRFEPARQPQGNKPVRAMTSVWVSYSK